MVPVLAVWGAWEVIPWEGGAGQIPVSLPVALETAQTFHPFGAGSCPPSKDRAQLCRALGNLSLGLTGLSDLLKLLVHGGFASWTDTHLWVMHQNKEILFPIGIPIGMCSSNPPGIVRSGRGWSVRALHLGGAVTS